jgi:hypothetical protein
MTRIRRSCSAIGILVVTLLCVAPGATHAERATQVYRPKHRLAQELLPVARAALGSEGSAVVDRGTNSLVLIGDASALASALALLEAQDQRQRTIVLRYESRGLSELEAQGYRVEWSVGAGGVRVGNVRLPRGESGARIRLRDQARSERSSFSGQLRLVDGGTGRISSGTEVPVTVRRGRRARTDLVVAESGFDATARVLGDGRVRVALAPFEGELAGRGSVDFTAAQTELELEPGQTVVIGELTRERSDARQEPAARDDVEEREERVLLLTATLE